MREFIKYTIAVLLTASIPAVVFGLFFILYMIRVEKRKAFLERVAREIGGKKVKKNYVFSYQGRTFSFNYQPGARHSAPSFYMEAQCARRGGFEVRKNISGDPDSVSMPLVGAATRFVFGEQVKTDDAEFDRDFYVGALSHSRRFATEFFSDPGKREAVKSLFQLGAHRISYHDKTLSVVWSPFKIKKDVDIGFVSQSIPSLKILSENIPEIEVQELQISKENKNFLLFASLPGVLLLPAFILNGWAYWQFHPLDPPALFAASKKYIYLAMGLYILIYLVKYRLPSLMDRTGKPFNLFQNTSGSQGSPPGPGEPNTKKSSPLSSPIISTVGVFFFIGLTWISFNYFGKHFAVLLNGALDSAPSQTHEVMVLDKNTDEEGGHYIYFPSWNKRGEEEKTKLNSRDFEKIIPGETMMTITTKPGRFGFEWIVKYHFR